jgi:tetratricopeptide (TPR) repeat protein
MRDALELDLLGVVEATDKSSAVESSWDYLIHYGRLFKHLRDAPINFIEIGTGRGASLKVWKSFFRNARIIGIGINPNAVQFADDRVAIEIGSQDDPGFLAQVCAKYPPTIVIDDGSHRASHMIYTFERVFPSLLPGGIYIIEDLALHFGENANDWKDENEAPAADHFLGIARSLLARVIPTSADGGTFRYILEHVDSIEIIRSAVAVHKKPAPPELSAALDFIDEYLRGRTPDAAVHQRLARFILSHSGSPDRAVAELQRAMQIGSQSPQLVRTCADIYAHHNRLAEALAMVEPGAAFFEDAELWHYAGHLNLGLRNHAAAADAFAKAVELNPSHPTFAYHLSLALEQLGKFPEALSAAQRGLDAAIGSQHESALRQFVEHLRDKITIHDKLMAQSARETRSEGEGELLVSFPPN